MSLLGTIWGGATSCVGLNHYPGQVKNGEVCSTKRNPANKFDKNAVQVLNSCGQIVGHADGTTAAGLAALMDKGLCTKVTAKVTGGAKNKFKLPLEISLYVPAPPKKEDGSLRSDKFGCFTIKNPEEKLKPGPKRKLVPKPEAASAQRGSGADDSAPAEKKRKVGQGLDVWVDFDAIQMPKRPAFKSTKEYTTALEEQLAAAIRAIGILQRKT